MKTTHLLLTTFCLCALGARTEASTLYGSTSAGGAGELWIIDATTGTGLQDVGPLSDAGSVNYPVTGLAFHPVTGVLYGSTGGTFPTPELLQINPTNAQVTVVGAYGAGAGVTMADIAFDSAGHLYGVSSSGGANLYSINTATGQATKIGTSGVGSTTGGGFAISSAGVFFGSPIKTDFGTFNPTNGVFSNITNPAKPAGATASYGSLAFDGSTLYGMNLGTPTHLVIFDALGNVTDVGPSVTSVDGIAFKPSPALTIQRATNGALITWPVWADGYRLQQNYQLGTTNWVTPTNSVTLTSTNNQVTISPLATNTYFRLISP